jgi:hypothetical protein
VPIPASGRAALGIAGREPELTLSAEHGAIITKASGELRFAAAIAD